MIMNEHINASIVRSKLLNEISVKRHPRLIMEITSSNWFNNVSIIEESSDDIKNELNEMIEREEPIPIDTILGEYLYNEGKIVIYKKSIELFSQHFGLEVKHVEFIVRLHEYAHAIFHLGSQALEPEAEIDVFIKERVKIFQCIPNHFHEWLAQCLCYSAILMEKLNAEKITFSKMMLKQPKIYHIKTSKVEEAFDKLLTGWGPILHDTRTGSLKADDAMENSI